MILVITDVSVRERRERAEREFVTNAAHELRTPLATITGAIQVLQSGAKDDPVERDRFLDHIDREAARLGRLTHSLLVLARAQTRAEAPIWRRSSSGRSSRDRRGVRRRRLSPNGHLSSGSRGPGRAGPGGTGGVQPDRERAAEHRSAGASSRRQELPSGSVALEVTDTGIGIAPERQDRIFDRFYRPTAATRAASASGSRSSARRSPARRADRARVGGGPGTTVRITLAGVQKEAAA